MTCFDGPAADCPRVPLQPWSIRGTDVTNLSCDTSAYCAVVFGLLRPCAQGRALMRASSIRDCSSPCGTVLSDDDDCRGSDIQPADVGRRFCVTTGFRAHRRLCLHAEQGSQLVRVVADTCTTYIDSVAVVR